MVVAFFIVMAALAVSLPAYQIKKRWGGEVYVVGVPLQSKANGILTLIKFQKKES